jgi:hypothetical protein
MRCLAAFVICASLPALAQGKGEIDWSRRVLIGHGQGAPDLNAPSVAVARLGAERAARVDACRNALETLKGLQIESGGSVGSLLQNDSTLTARVDGELKGVKAIKNHYFSDGGVSLDIEVPLDELPAEIARAVQIPAGVAPLRGTAGAPSSAAGMPRTMVLIAEQNIGMTAPQAAWMGGAPVSTDLRIAENTVLDQLKNGGFSQLVDPEIASEKTASVGGITTEITAAQARKLKSLTGAEVILSGQVIATSRGPLEDLGPGWRSCAATISGRVVDTGDGDILSTSEATQNAAQPDDLTCGKEAIKKASKVFAQDMIKKIGERWPKAPGQ